jgi:YVTN family beta-propeller protein
MSGVLATRAEIDLNSYLVVTLNHDKTISFINPQVSLNVTKLESLVTLPAVGADWALSKNGDAFFVSMPNASAVAIIDTSTRKIVGTLPMGVASKPMRVAIQPDGQYVWVCLDGSGDVAVIDTVTRASVKRIKVGGGLHSIAFSSDSRRAYVTNSADDTVSIIDTTGLTKLRELQVGATPVALDYGSVGNVVYVAGLNADSLTVIDADRLETITTIPVGRTAVAVAFDPSGRFALVLNQTDSKILVIDSATNRVIARALVAGEPDQIAFTERYAYIRGLKSEKLTLIDLLELRAGKLTPVDIQAGGQSPLAQPDLIGPARMIVPTPEGNSVMIANASEGTLYYYVEGMMAPMGTFSTYKRLPLALAVLDLSLREVAPGEYSVPIRLPAAGPHSVPIFIEQPRTVSCFKLAVENGGAAPAAMLGPTIRVEPAFATDGIEAGVPSTLTLNIRDAVSGEPVSALHDLTVLVLQEAGLRQQHPTISELNNGQYAVRLTFTQPGAYRLLVAAPSRNTRMRDLSPIAVTVKDGSRPAAIP